MYRCQQLLYNIHTFTFQNSKLQAEIVFTYLKVQYAKDKRGLSVTGEIHHQHTNLLNISHLSCRVPVANDCHVKPPSPGTSLTNVKSSPLYFWELYIAYQ